MAEALPARVRVSAVSIAYNLSMGVLGGTTPLVATVLMVWSHDPLAPAYYLMGAASLSLVALVS